LAVGPFLLALQISESAQQVGVRMEVFAPVLDGADGPSAALQRVGKVALGEQIGAPECSPLAGAGGGLLSILNAGVDCCGHRCRSLLKIKMAQNLFSGLEPLLDPFVRKGSMFSRYSQAAPDSHPSSIGKLAHETSVFLFRLLYVVREEIKATSCPGQKRADHPALCADPAHLFYDGAT
jgi:hypothetical protein